MPRTPAHAHVPQQPDFAGRTPSGRSRLTWVLSAVLLGLVVVVAAIFIVRSLDDDGPAPTPSPTASSAASTPGGGDLPTTIPTAAPQGVRWELFRGAPVPVSDDYGPRDRGADTAAGFDRSPEGALVAAAQILKHAGYSAGRKSWEPTLQQQFVAGADRDTLLATLRGVDEPASSAADLSPLTGFIYHSYSPDTAVISLVHRGKSGDFAVSTTVVWRDGDWRMVAPPGGAWTSVSRPLVSPAGVVAWGAR